MHFDTDNGIAFFDFDLTLSRRDTIRDFPRFVFGRIGFTRRLLGVLPFLYLFRAGLCSATYAKEAYVTRFYGGMREDDLVEKSRHYSLHRLPKILDKNMMRVMQSHKDQGHTVVVVSASLSLWLAPWCEENGLELLATEVEMVNGEVSGRLQGLNCHGEEKVSRIRERYALSQFDKIYAYGDSKADYPMLGIADYAWLRGEPVAPHDFSKLGEEISHAG